MVRDAAGWWIVAWIAGGAAIGAIAYAAILRPLQRAGEREGWNVLSAMASMLASVSILWGALAGLYVALDRIRLSARTAAFADRGMETLFIISLTWIVARACAASVAEYGRRSNHRLLSLSLASTIVQAIVLIVGLLTVLSSLGIAVGPLLATLGVGGLAVALALNDTLTNLFAGVHLVAARQIRIGDYVKFDFAEGEVADIQWHDTTVRDLHGDVVVIPNAKVNTSVFVNYSLNQRGVLAPVTATLSWKGTYSQLAGAARAAASAAIASVEHKEGGQPDVRLTALNETNVQIAAFLPLSNPRDRAQAAGVFLETLHDEIAKSVT